MDEEASVGQKIKEFILRNLIFVGFVFFGLILCLVGVYQYFISIPSASGVKFITNQPDTTSPAQTQDITVDIEGEVLKPGVYELQDGARLQDAINKAGGFTANSDKEYISKNVNLAQKVTDGAKVYIPAQGEITTDKSVLGTSNTSQVVVAQNTSVENSSLININTADLNALDTLPKVGPVTAQKIVDNRPYGTIEDLVNKKVMGQKTFDGLKDKITVQ